MRKKFSIRYAPQTKGHLRFLERKYHPLICSTIEEQLQFEPNVETKNRKPLNPPGIFDSEWEIRFGPNNQFRVFYETDEQAGEVHIIAIGIKRRNHLLIEGNKIMKLASITEKMTFEAYIEECMGEPIVFTKKGKMVAVLLSVTDEEQLSQLILAHSSEFKHILETGKQQIKEGKGISHEDFWRQMDAE